LRPVMLEGYWKSIRWRMQTGMMEDDSEIVFRTKSRECFSAGIFDA